MEISQRGTDAGDINERSVTWSERTEGRVAQPTAPTVKDCERVMNRLVNLANLSTLGLPPRTFSLYLRCDRSDSENKTYWVDIANRSFSTDGESARTAIEAEALKIEPDARPFYLHDGKHMQFTLATIARALDVCAARIDKANQRDVPLSLY